MSNISSKSERVSSPGRPKDEAKRKAILEAAISLFMSEGVTRSTMDAIASKANVSKITVYNHFGNKDELFLTVIRERCDGHVGQHIFEGLTGEKPETELLKIAQCFISMIQAEDSIAMYRVILAEAKDNSEINTLFYEQGPQKLIERFGDYLRLVEKNEKYAFEDKRKLDHHKDTDANTRKPHRCIFLDHQYGSNRSLRTRNPSDQHPTSSSHSSRESFTSRAF